VREAAVAAKATGGAYVLDGVPRTMPQAQALYQMGMELGMTAEVALHLEADDRELMRRLLARAVLEGRSDDTEGVIKQRLNLYHEVTQPIVAWYGARGILLSVDAMRPVEQVSQELLTALEALRATPSPEMDPASLARAFGASGATPNTSGARASCRASRRSSCRCSRGSALGWGPPIWRSRPGRRSWRRGP